MNINIYSSKAFLNMDSAYWGLGSTKDFIYVGLCSHDPNNSATIFSFSRNTKEIRKAFSLSEIVTNKKGYLPQGKIHTSIYEGQNGNLYFGSHFAYPFGKPQPVRYEGGHVICFNPKTAIIEDLGIPVKNEGILTLISDKNRMILYGLSAPSFIFFAFSVNNRKVIYSKRITEGGSICRSLVIDTYGNVYGSYEKNNIFKFNKKTASIEYLETKLLDSNKKIREWKGKHRGGVNYIGRKIWRSAIWHEKTQKIYGIHAETSKLFSYDPRIQVINNICFMGNNGLGSNLDRIYPTLSLTVHENIIYYIFMNGFFDYSRSRYISGYVSLISYNLINNKLKNLGYIENDKHKVLGVAGSAITEDGILYLIGAVDVKGNERYNKFNKINNKGFKLCLIEIKI